MLDISGMVQYALFGYESSDTNAVFFWIGRLIHFFPSRDASRRVFSSCFLFHS